MKKLFSMLLAALMVLSLGFTALASDADNSLQAIVDKGEFVLGFDESFPPMGFKDEDGKHVGFDLDVAAALCEVLGVKLVLQPISWAAKELELNSGAIDCIWNGFTMTPERQEALSFSVPYLENAQILVVKKDSEAQTLADLNGKALALQAGSSAADALSAAEDFKASLKEIAEFDDNMVALMELDQGGVDAVLMDIIVANYYIAQKGAEYRVLSEALAPELFGIGMRKGDAALTAAVNDALETLVESGKLAEISTVWFGEDITVAGKYLAEQK